MTKPIFGNIAGLGSRRRHHTWFQFAAGSLRCYKRVFPGFTLDLLLLSKTSTPKFQINLKRTLQKRFRNS